MLTSSDNETTMPVAKLTEEQRAMFEARMEELWNARQEELKKAQEGLADLPGMLRERILTIKGYLDDVEGGLGGILEGRRDRRAADKVDGGGDDGDDDGSDAVDDNIVRDVVDALRDLEYLLSDVDMARDFHTLGGWSPLVSLLEVDDEERRRRRPPAEKEEDEEDTAMLLDEIRSLAAMAVGTAVGNMGEFRPWALEGISPPSSSREDAAAPASPPPPSSSALSVLMSSFQRELASRTEGMIGGMTMAVVGPSSYSDARHEARATYRLRAAYALGSLLRGNPSAQAYFVSNGGPETLVRVALGTLSSARGPPPSASSSSSGARGAILDYKFASRVLALAEDVVMDVVLHGDEYDDRDGTNDDDAADAGDDRPGGGAPPSSTASRLVAAFATERWCDLSLRMLSPPPDAVGDVRGRGMRQGAVTAVRALAPACRDRSGEAAWGTDGVERVRSDWNREGSDDGMDPVYRRELLDLTDEVLRELR
jgi:hypothetical protein